MLTHVACTLMVLVVVVRGMPEGAPPSACNSLTPVGHNITNTTTAITAQNGGQVAASNYTVTISPDSVEQGGTITVSIMANGTSYKGFLVAAVVEDGDPNNNVTVGMFNTAPADAMWKNGPCRNEMGDNSSATHNSRVEKNSTVLTWKAPTDYTGAACIRGAIVKDYATWWQLEPICFKVEKPEGGDDGMVGDDSKDSSPSIIASVAVMFTAAVLLRL